MKTFIAGTIVAASISIAALAMSPVRAAEEEGFTPLFNGQDLSGWVNVNCAPSTFSVRDEMIVCTGVPTGVMRTAEGHSANVSAGNALFSLIGFMGMYTILSILFLFLMYRQIEHGPEAPDATAERGQALNEAA